MHLSVMAVSGMQYLTLLGMEGRKRSWRSRKGPYTPGLLPLRLDGIRMDSCHLLFFMTLRRIAAHLGHCLRPLLVLPFHMELNLALPDISRMVLWWFTCPKMRSQTPAHGLCPASSATSVPNASRAFFLSRSACLRMRSVHCLMSS